MHIKTIITILIIFIFKGANAQPTYRNIRDLETKRPIPYATIKLLNKPGGAIASGSGAFQLVFSDADSILITSVGYESKIMAGKDLSDDIFLKPKSIALKNVTVKALQLLRTLKLGYDTSKFQKDLNWGPGGKVEFAQQIELPDSTRTYHLKKVILHIKATGCAGHLLLHIYKQDSVAKIPGEEIFSKLVTFEKSDVRKGKATIDLAKEGIYWGDEKVYYVGFSWLPDAVKEQCLSTIYLVPSPSNKIVCFSRSISNANYEWQKLGVGKAGAPQWGSMVCSVEVDEMQQPVQKTANSLF